MPKTLRVTTLAAALTFSVFAPSALAATPRPIARTDRVNAMIGGVRTVSVLTNDTVTHKAKARIRILRAPSALDVAVSGTNIVVTVAATTPIHVYRIRYRVIDVHDRRDAATLRIQVVPYPDAPNPSIVDQPVSRLPRSGPVRSRTSSRTPAMARR